MPRFSVGRAEDEGNESSDSDHRSKRRKTNPWHAQQQFDKGYGPTSAAGKSKIMEPNSFAAKMMAKMGYVEGQGLGATGKGRLAPIETQLRPQGAGLGAVKEKTKQAKAEEKREAAFRGETLEESSEEERRQKKERKQRLKEAGIGGATASTRRPAKAKYKTAAELENDAEGLKIPNVLKSIIDATGQETRLLASAAGLMSASNNMVPAETERMKLSRIAQRESAAFADEWKALQERRAFYEQQDVDLQGRQGLIVAETEDLDSLIVSVERLSTSPTKDWASLTAQLQELQISLEALGGSFDLQEVAVSAILPLMREAMVDWDPLADPQGVLPHLLQLRQVLQPKQVQDRDLMRQNGASRAPSSNKITTTYESMIYTLWLPPVKAAALRWDVYNSKALGSVIDSWFPMLPPFVLANLVDGLIVNRLSAALAAWRPARTKSNDGRGRGSSAISPHKWLFPWFEFLDDQHTDFKSSTGLMAEVKRRLKSILSNWDMSLGMIPGLHHWAKLFSPDNAFSHLLIRHALPRLAAVMQADFDIDPADQDLHVFDRVLQWIRPPFFSSTVVAQLFADVFFPKYHRTLYMWLSSPGGDHREIMQWYQWWKSLLDERLSGLFLKEGQSGDSNEEFHFNDHPIVKAQWDKALQIINVALDTVERFEEQPTAQDESKSKEQQLSEQVQTALQPIVFPPLKNPSSSSTKHNSSKGTHSRHDRKPTPTQAAADPSHPANDGGSPFKDVLEDWCATSGLLLIPLREADVTSGLPLFRVTASASGRGGVVVYIRGDVVWVRKSAASKSKSAATEGGAAKQDEFMPMGLDEGLIELVEGR